MLYERQNFVRPNSKYFELSTCRVMTWCGRASNDLPPTKITLASVLEEQVYLTKALSEAWRNAPNPQCVRDAVPSLYACKYHAARYKDAQPVWYSALGISRALKANSNAPYSQGMVERRKPDLLVLESFLSRLTPASTPSSLVFEVLGTTVTLSGFLAIFHNYDELYDYCRISGDINSYY